MINRGALGLPTLLVAIWLCDTRAAVAQMDIGTLRVFVAADTTTTALAQHAVRDATIKRLRAVDSALRPILPSGTRFDVSVEQCGHPDYLYDKTKHRVVLCAEMDGFARALVRTSIGRERVGRMEDVDRDEEAEEPLDGFAIFAILHEVGHAAIDQLRLPAPGNSEEAADGFAAYALLARGDNATVLGAAQWLAWLEAYLVSTSTELPQDDAGDHPLPRERYERLRCLAEGQMRMPADVSGSKTRPDCQGEWLRLSVAWQQLLGGRFDELPARRR